MQLKSAGAYTRQLSLKLLILTVYFLKTKGLRAYSGLIDIFVNYYDVEARCAFFFYLCTLSNQNNKYIENNIKWHFSGRISKHLCLCNKKLTKNYRMALYYSGIFNVRSTNFIFIPVTWLTADVCHVNCTKHGSDLSTVRNYITFAPCKLFLTMTVIILCNTFQKVKRYNFSLSSFNIAEKIKNHINWNWIL